MKEIFSESKTVGTYEYAYYLPPRWNLDYGSGRLPAEVRRPEVPIYCRVKAYYQQKFNILHVQAEGPDPDQYEEWAPSGREFLERVHGKSAAIRRAIEIADAWYQQVLDSIPPPDTRTDEEVERDYHAEKGRAEVAE